MTALSVVPAAESRIDVTEEDIRRALDSVIDPELDEPITDLGFIRSLQVRAGVDGAFVEVHLRLPTSFCSPNFAYLMASDSKDAIAALPAVKHVVVELDDHHDSDLINAGLAADAGYRGTFLHEAEDSLEELRWTFRRKAHTAALERCLTYLLRANPELAETQVGTVRVGDLPTGRNKDALLRRRSALGLPEAADSIVLVNHDGDPYPPGPSRWRCAGHARPASPSTGMRISAAACCAHATRAPAQTSVHAPKAPRPKTTTNYFRLKSRRFTHEHHASRPGRRLPRRPENGRSAGPCSHRPFRRRR
jgi:metal-sulfur cluster biosynthetic enzyme